MYVDNAAATTVTSSVKMRSEMLAEPEGPAFAAYLDERLAALNRPREVLSPAEQQEAFKAIAAKYDPRAISYWEQEAMTAELRAAGLLPNDPAVYNPHPATDLLTPRVAPTLEEAKRIQDLWKTEPRLHQKRNLIVNLGMVQYGPQAEHKFEFLSLMNTIVEYRNHDPALSKIPFKSINTYSKPEHETPLTKELADRYGEPGAEDPYSMAFTEMVLRSSGISETEEEAEEKEREQQNEDNTVADKAIAVNEALVAETMLTTTESAPPIRSLTLPDGRPAY